MTKIKCFYPYMLIMRYLHNWLILCLLGAIFLKVLTHFELHFGSTPSTSYKCTWTMKMLKCSIWQFILQQMASSIWPIRHSKTCGAAFETQTSKQCKTLFSKAKHTGDIHKLCQETSQTCHKWGLQYSSCFLKKRLNHIITNSSQESALQTN